MTRVLWIALLLAALIIFTGFTILCVVAWITHKHLNSTGLTMLIANGYAAWFIFGILRTEIRKGKLLVKNSPANPN
jgi:hypothetical protein